MSPRPNAAYAFWTMVVFWVSDMVSSDAIYACGSHPDWIRSVDASRRVGGRLPRRWRHLRPTPENRLPCRPAGSGAAGGSADCHRVPQRGTASGPMKVGIAALSNARDVAPADQPRLDLRDVDALFDRMSSTAGAGSGAARAQLLRELMAAATAAEQDFLFRLLSGELRQGALEGVLTEAVARAAGIPAPRIRRAAMLAGDLAPVACAALGEGEAGLAAFALKPMQPVQPMLADSAEDTSEALEALGEASFEYKLDGARIQVHKVDDEVRVFSRALRDVTVAVPEIVAVARSMPARQLVLDGEAIVLRPDGSPVPFQKTMRRFGRKLDVDRLASALPITPMFFDALFLDGDALVDEPLSRRATPLAEQSGRSQPRPRPPTPRPDG